MNASFSMKQPLPIMPQPQHENRYPDCLWMELEAIPVPSQQLDLPVTIKFNEQWEPLLNGRVKFGLKGGELRLKLKNGQIPYNCRHLTESFELYIENETGETDPFQSTLCQVTTNGSEVNPGWVFELKMGSQVLKGSLQKKKLGTLMVTDNSCGVEATFEVLLKYLHLTDTEELWPPNISRNKRIVLERAIAKHLLQSKLQPYLSRTVLQYD